MASVSLPHDAKAGPTKPEVRAVLLGKLDLGPTDHLVEVGSCTGAVTVAAARRAGRVTALERRPERLRTTRRNLAANETTATVEMCDRYQALDHVELRARRDTLTADAGATVRGHEFHYSRAAVGADARFAFDAERGDGIDDGRDGLTEYRTLGTYCHLHPESGAFDRFLAAARAESADPDPLGGG
jgi:cobyrinic acid a,c-diamide synthase